jgi:hypothetical protein
MWQKRLRSVQVIRKYVWLSWLLSAVIFVVMIGAFTDFLMEVIGTWQTSLLALGVMIAVVLVAHPMESFIQSLRARNQAGVTVEEVQRPVPRYRGLIVLSSPGRGIGSAETAIRYHWRGLRDEFAEGVLECCWVITAGPASKASALEMESRMIQAGLPPTLFYHRDLTAEDADNPEAVHREVDAIYAYAASALRLEEEEIIADYTGGTKSMTSGLVLACASPRRSLQFMKPQRYDGEGRADPAAGSTPVAIEIRLDMAPVRPPAEAERAG